MATISLKNHDQNAPWWWKRLESALLIGLIPSFTGFITAIPMTEHHKVWALAGAGFFVGLLKFTGILLGDQIEPEKLNSKPAENE
jgi:hypothetical protein